MGSIKNWSPLAYYRTDDIGVFETLLDEYGETVSRLEQRQQTVARREAQAIEGKERRKAAEEAVHRAITVALTVPDVPDALGKLFNETWRSYLLLIYLDGGEQGTVYREALELTEEIVRYVSPKTSQVLRRSAVRTRGPLLHSVRDALHRMLVGDEAQQACFLEALQRLHYQAIKAEPPPSVLGKQGARDDEQPGQGVATVPIGQARNMTPITPQTSSDDPYLKQARSLPAGTWLELVAEEGKSKRIKLSWRSPLTHRVLFVNIMGFKEIERYEAELAILFRTRKLTVMDSRPLFDRLAEIVDTG